MAKSEQNVISIRNDVLSTLAEIDLTKATSRKDFVRASDLLAKAALRAAREPDGKQLMGGLDVARKCVADACKAFGAYQDEDLIKEMERRFEEEQTKILEFLSTILTPEQLANLRERLAAPGEGS